LKTFPQLAARYSLPMSAGVKAAVHAVAMQCRTNADCLRLALARGFGLSGSGEPLGCLGVMLCHGLRSVITFKCVMRLSVHIKGLPV
jgi:hypothetical protein